MDRREFLRGSLGSVYLFLVEGCGSEDHDSGPLEVPKAVIWIEAGVCTGCLLSLLGSSNPTVETLLPGLPLRFQETLMPSFGTEAMGELFSTQLPKPFALVVDGGVPSAAKAALLSLGTDTAGQEWTGEALIRKLGAEATWVLSVGSCASFGGIAAAAPNPTNTVHVGTLVAAQKLIRIPGCPPPGQRIAEALRALLSGMAIPLDALSRPLAFYEHTVHAACPRLPKYMAGEFAAVAGDPEGCLLMVGCKGIVTKSDCPTRRYAGRSFCIAASHPCIGCAAPGFPDGSTEFTEEPDATAPFYAELVR